MDPRGRADRSSSTQGFLINQDAADLIGDIHRQQRRRLLRRAAQLTALAVVLLLVGLAFKLAADRRAQSRSLDGAREHFRRGTVVELRAAVAELAGSLEEYPAHQEMTAALGLARAQLWLEFGEQEEEARSAIIAAEGTGDLGDANVARAMRALADGDVEAARSAASAPPDDGGIAPHHGAWVLASVALVGDGSEIATAIQAIDEAREADPMTAYDRIRAALVLATGEGREALAALERAREQNRTHMGLAADEALYNAYLRQELSGVADVADQLLRAGDDVLGARDRAHARLARGVVHVQTGEPDEGLARIEEAWPLLPRWDRAARELALQTALEAGDTTRVQGWLEDAGLPEAEVAVYDAWARLARGDVMNSLSGLASLPQEHPRVAYLQALALVEQGRWEEAGPWLERTERLLPGRIEIEVARARADLHVGDKVEALGKLQALAEEEPYAPRAWTGLGEALLLQDEPSPREAQKALERAIGREPVASEAMLLLANVWIERRGEDPEAGGKARDLLERAAKTNPHLARYEQTLALHLADLGADARAYELLEGLQDRPGVDADAILRLADLSIARAGEVDEALRARVDGWLAKAEERGAGASALLRVRAALVEADDDKAAWVIMRDEVRAALEENPEDVRMRILASRLHMHLAERDTAETVIRRGLQVTPSSEHGLLYLEWARIEHRNASRKKAAAHARVAWKRLLNENRPPAILLGAADFAAMLWARQNKPKVATAIVRALTERLPRHADAWVVRADVELASGRAAEARQSAEHSIELDENNPRAHELHGHTLLRFGRKDDAKAAYERAIELAKGTREEAAFRENLRRL